MPQDVTHTNPWSDDELLWYGQARLTYLAHKDGRDRAVITIVHLPGGVEVQLRDLDFALVRLPKRIRTRGF